MSSLLLNSPETLKVSLRLAFKSCAIGSGVPSSGCSWKSLFVWGFSAFLDIRFLLDNDTRATSRGIQPPALAIKTVSLS